MKNKKIGILVGPNAEIEALAIRSTVEYLGYEVVTKWVGRPQDFIDFWKGKTFSRDTKLLLLCFHGKAGKFVMPRLAKDVYLAEEPRGDIGYAGIEDNVLKQKTIISTACTVGNTRTAEQIVKNKSRFIAPKGYIEGNAALIFTQLFFYHLLITQKIDPAFQKSVGLDEETGLFKLYT